MADGRQIPVDRGPGTPPPLGPTPEGVYGKGAGRSVRGLPFVWESPGVDELRGSLWAVSPGGVQGAEEAEGGAGWLTTAWLAKKRKEGRT